MVKQVGLAFDTGKCRFMFVALVMATILVLVGACGGEPTAISDPSTNDSVQETKSTDTAELAAPATGSPREDKAALVAVLEALNARPAWADEGKTLNDVPPEERIGIMTDDSGRVVGLLLSNSLLSGKLPAEIGDLAALRWLDLGANQISGHLPPELGNLSNLEVIILSSNLLTGPLPSELGKLSALEVMNLSGNQLVGEIPPELGKLTNLRELALRYNQLAGEIPSELGSLTALRWLDLTGSMLSGDLPAGLRALSDQRVLDLADIYFAVDTTVPYSAVEGLESDSAELIGLLSQATECRGGLRFPKDSFCVGGGRYILGHDSDGRMVVRDLHWRDLDGPGSSDEALLVLSEGTIPGFLSSPNLSISFSSRDGDFVFEENSSVLFESGRGVRAVVTSYTANRELWAAVYQEDFDLIKQLAASGANINGRDSHGATILSRAVQEGNVEMARVLVEAGADVDLDTPLITAIDRGNAQIVRLLVEAGADVNPWGGDHPWGHSLLDEAQFYGDAEIIRVLADAGAESAWPDDEAPLPSNEIEAFYPTDASGLRDATIDGDADVVRTLIEDGVNVNAKDAGGESILASAIIYQDDPEIVQILVDAGADVNAKDNYGNPVLFWAISFSDWGAGSKAILQILVDAGADVNAKDGGYGNPILFSAIEDANLEIVGILVNAGADVNAKDVGGESLLSWAKRWENPEIIQILVDAGATE